MKRVSRLFLAVPMMAAVASPSLGNTFFDFSLSASSASVTYTLSGRTQPGDNDENAGYSPVGFQSLTFNISGGANQGSYNLLAENRLWEGTTGSGANDRFASDTSFFFNESANSFQLLDGGNQSTALWWTLSDPADFASPSTVPTFAITGSVETFVTGNQRRLFIRDGTFTEGPPPDLDTSGGVTVIYDANVSLVPEINGSGFAYIAFILGALGLWLYSGAGRGRQQETAAVV